MGWTGVYTGSVRGAGEEAKAETDGGGKRNRGTSSRRPTFSFCIGPLIYSVHPSCCRCSGGVGL